MENLEAIMVSCGDGEVHVYLLRPGGQPFGRWAPELEDIAKLRCRENIGIQFDEWVAIDVEPTWLQQLKAAYGQAIAKHPESDSTDTDNHP